MVALDLRGGICAASVGQEENSARQVQDRYRLIFMVPDGR